MKCTTRHATTYVSSMVQVNFLYVCYEVIQGNRGIAPVILNLSIRYGCVLSFKFQLLYTGWKKPGYPLKRRLGGPQGHSEHFWDTRTVVQLYSHSTRIWYNFTDHLSQKRKKGSIQKSRNNLWDIIAIGFLRSIVWAQCTFTVRTDFSNNKQRCTNRN